MKTEIFYDDLQDLYDEYVENFKTVDKSLQKHQSIFEEYRTPKGSSDYLKRRAFLVKQINLLESVRSDLQYSIKWMKFGYEPDVWNKGYKKKSKTKQMKTIIK